MILHSDNSVTLTEEEWLKVRPRWINMADANPDDGQVVLCAFARGRIGVFARESRGPLTRLGR